MHYDLADNEHGMTLRDYFAASFVESGHVFKIISDEDVDLVCFLEYSPEEKGYRDSYGAPYEPDIEECMTLNNAYIAGTDVDIAHMILQSMVDHIEVTALEKFLDK